ncbi:MAG: BlaI/MecI/CopY family transcriptional regulator [Dehalococcoidia bacterium]
MSRLGDVIFRPYRVGVRKALGELEAQVMELLWQRHDDEAVTVRDVYEIFRTRRGLAYTTIMGTMSRLAKKGLLTVDNTGQTHVYSVRVTKEEFTHDMVSQLLDSLFLDVSGAARAYFQSSADPSDREEIERILRDVERRRREHQA